MAVSLLLRVLSLSRRAIRNVLMSRHPSIYLSLSGKAVLSPVTILLILDDGSLGRSGSR